VRRWKTRHVVKETRIPIVISAMSRKWVLLDEIVVSKEILYKNSSPHKGHLYGLPHLHDLPTCSAILRMDVTTESPCLDWSKAIGENDDQPASASGYWIRHCF
jgi:hypothetical protein